MPTTCTLCSANDFDWMKPKDAKSGEMLHISLCKQCGLVQQAQLPTDTELKIYYSHNYRTDYKQTYHPKPKYVRRAGLAALERVRFLSTHLPAKHGTRLLDIGAGGGEFVYVASKSGFQATGIEPNQGYSEFAKQQYGIDVRTAMLDEVAGASADLVTLFHVFEHMANPHAVIDKIAAVLAPDGYLFIEVPNITQSDASPHNIYFKAHLFYYGRATLVAMASRWFEPLEIQDSGNLRVLFQKRRAPLPAPNLPSAAQAKQVARRLREKGWGEYLFEGGGLLKPVRRLEQMLTESRIGDAQPRALLDQLIAAPRA